MGKDETGVSLHPATGVQSCLLVCWVNSSEFTIFAFSQVIIIQKLLLITQCNTFLGL